MLGGLFTPETLRLLFSESSSDSEEDEEDDWSARFRRVYPFEPDKVKDFGDRNVEVVVSEAEKGNFIRARRNIHQGEIICLYPIDMITWFEHDEQRMAVTTPDEFLLLERRKLENNAYDIGCLLAKRRIVGSAVDESLYVHCTGSVLRPHERHTRRKMYFGQLMNDPDWVPKMTREQYEAKPDSSNAIVNPVLHKARSRGGGTELVIATLADAAALDDKKQLFLPVLAKRDIDRHEPISWRYGSSYWYRD